MKFLKICSSLKRERKNQKPIKTQTHFSNFLRLVSCGPGLNEIVTMQALLIIYLSPRRLVVNRELIKISRMACKTLEAKRERFGAPTAKSGLVTRYFRKQRRRISQPVSQSSSRREQRERLTASRWQRKKAKRLRARVIKCI
jgi:hypothetical protein